MYNSHIRPQILRKKLKKKPQVKSFHFCITQSFNSKEKICFRVKMVLVLLQIFC